jgi:hypothetical protein
MLGEINTDKETWDREIFIKTYLDRKGKIKRPMPHEYNCSQTYSINYAYRRQGNRLFCEFVTQGKLTFPVFAPLIHVDKK